MIRRALLFAALALTAGCASTGDEGLAPPPDGAWSTQAPMPHARAAHAVAATADAIYVLGGTDETGAPVLAVDRFDGAAWTTPTKLPGNGLNASAAAAIDGRIYVVGGFNTTTNRPSDQVFAYDPARNSWSTLAPLPSPRGGHVAAVLDGRIHVFGGGNAERTLADHDEYDPASNTWTARIPLPRAQGSPAAAVLDGRIHIIGGRSGPHDLGFEDMLPRGNALWLSRQAIEPRGIAGAVEYRGCLLLIGGESQARRACLDEVLQSCANGLWAPVPSLPEPRSFARAVNFRDAVWVLGGATRPMTSHATPGTSSVFRYAAE